MMNREQQLLVEAEARREREAYRELGEGLFAEIERVRNENGPVDAGLPDDTLETLGVKDREVSSAPQDQQSAAPAAPSATSTTNTGEEPMWQSLARLELSQGMDPARQSDKTIEERIANLERRQQD